MDRAGWRVYGLPIRLERGIWGFLEDCLEDGLLLAPGPSFGKGHYDAYVRVCFTCASPDQVAEGCRRLARRLGR